MDVRGKRVLVRVDFNVPLKNAGAGAPGSEATIADDSRIRAALPTIRDLRERGARVILCSHLGRPDGKRVESLSLRPCAERLGELLGTKVAFADDCVGAEVKAAAAALGAGSILMLENVRFHPEEERNDSDFARALAGLADLYVNDAFGTAHRAHASTEGIAHHLPAVAGHLMEKELRNLGGLLEQPARPFLAIVGGAKVSTKLAVLGSLLERVDALALGGAMANTFLLAQGRDVGASLAEPEHVDEARRLLASGKTILLPVDVVVAERLDARSSRVVDVGERVEGVIADVGPRSLERIAAEVARAKTIFWNGPLGYFENPAFAVGTRRLAELLAASGAVTVVGGGESAQAVEEAGVADRLTHVSTGGGASLELLEGRELPGVRALQDA